MLTDPRNPAPPHSAASVAVPPLGPSRFAWPDAAPGSQSGALPPTEKKRAESPVPLRLLVEQGRLKAQQEAKALPPRNQELLRLLRDWMSTPDELGEAWWEEFRRDMAQNRPRFSSFE